MKSTCNNSDVSDALYTLRNTEPEFVPVSTYQVMYCARDALKARLREDPEYVMDKYEFAVFNWFRTFYPERLESEEGQRSTEAFWNSHTADR